jgi:hypothetical protein
MLYLFLVTVTINMYKHLTLITDLILLEKPLLNGNVCTQLILILLAVILYISDYYESW